MRNDEFVESRLGLSKSILTRLMVTFLFDCLRLGADLQNDPKQSFR